jgi:methionine-rich copper-binding protein CopC
VRLRESRRGTEPRGTEPDARPERLTVSRLSGPAAFVTVALGAVLTLFSAIDGAGGSAVTSTSPADGATLARAPAEVELFFTGPVDPARSHVSVRDGAGNALEIGPPRPVADDRLSQPVRGTATGEVRVTYHVRFVDGAQLSGTLSFGIGSATVDTDATAAGSPHRHGVDPLGAALLVIDGVVALGAIALLLRRPRRRTAPPTRPAETLI